MDIFITVAKILFGLIAVWAVCLPLFRERTNYQFVWSIWKRFRVSMFFECLGMIILTFVHIVALSQVPGLNIGWTALFFDGNTNNMVFIPVIEGVQSSHLSIRLLVLLFFLVFIFVVPFLARIEEKMFRYGHNTWSTVLPQSIHFGLIHLFAGVSLAAGLSLILLGLFYGYKYKRAFDQAVQTKHYLDAHEEAFLVSTTYHSMYNIIVLSGLTVLFLIVI